MKKLFRWLFGFDLPSTPSNNTQIPVQTVATVKSPEEPKVLTPKEQATLKNEPWVNVTNFELVSRNGSTDLGAFTLDWNEDFIIQLTKQGYRGATEEAIVEQWFTEVCRNVALETFEQHDAQPMNRITKTTRDDGKVEFS